MGNRVTVLEDRGGVERRKNEVREQVARAVEVGEALCLGTLEELWSRKNQVT